MEKKKNKKSNTALIFAGVFAVVLTGIFIIFIAALIQSGKNEISKNGLGDSNPPIKDDSAKTGKFASYFPGCGLINDGCLSSKCNQFFLCNDKKYLVCEIYDCGENFGVGTKDENGKINIERKIKQDTEKIMKMVSKCKGGVEIINSACEGGKLKIQAKVTTAGDCKIEAFMVAYGGGQTESKSFMSAEFSDMGNNLYAVEIGRCDNILEVIAVGEGGVSIKKIFEKTIE